MSIRIALSDAPEFYTNQDIVAGRVILSLNRPEQIGAIIVKLEGESRTALAVPTGENASQGGPNSPRARARPVPPGAYPGAGNIVHENHKILYKVAQVFPDETGSPMPTPVVVQPGMHAFNFHFKLPFNNACSDPRAMATIGGLVGQGGYAANPGIFGLGGIRVMDGSKQLLYQHVTKTLPPSFTGFPRQAEVRYFVKVTIQRPGFFKENWRYQVGFKFLPIEPPRPEGRSQEAYARRPFAFVQRSPAGKPSKRGSIFGNLASGRKASSGFMSPSGSSAPASAGAEPRVGELQADLPPTIEMSARLPHPSILTCNQPVPLRLIAKKVNPSKEQVYLVSLQIDLVGFTTVRCQELRNEEETRWVVVSRMDLAIPLCEPAGTSPVGTETVVPASLWRDAPLPNTVMPSFETCNLTRAYKLELKLGLSWGLPSKNSKGPLPQSIFLPLTFSHVEVYSGMAPPPSLVKAMSTRRRPPRRSGTAGGRLQTHQEHGTASGSDHPNTVPVLPPRTIETGGEAAPPYSEAPPTYEEAMGEEMTGPIFPPGATRPAYSGVTNENAPLSIPEKG
jgi:hypothetical protein